MGDTVVSSGENIVKTADLIKKLQAQRAAVEADAKQHRSWATNQDPIFQDMLAKSGTVNYSQKQADQINRLRAMMDPSFKPTTATAMPVGPDGLPVYSSGVNLQAIQQELGTYSGLKAAPGVVVGTPHSGRENMPGHGDAQKRGDAFEKGVKKFTKWLGF
jgi:hypothetical protein